MAEQVPAREQVMAALAVLLATLVGVRIERNLDESASTFPAIVLMDGDHDASMLGTTEMRYLMTFDLVLIVTGSEGRVDGAALNSLWARVVKLFSDNPQLGGLVREMQEVSFVSEGSDQEAGQAPIGGATSRWQAEFYTPIGDPYTVFTP